MNIGERVACIETKLKTIERLLYLIIAGVGIQATTSYIPLTLSPFL